MWVNVLLVLIAAASSRHLYYIVYSWVFHNLLVQIGRYTCVNGELHIEPTRLQLCVLGAVSVLENSICRVWLGRPYGIWLWESNYISVFVITIMLWSAPSAFICTSWNSVSIWGHWGLIGIHNSHIHSWSGKKTNSQWNSIPMNQDKGAPLDQYWVLGMMGNALGLPMSHYTT